MKHTPGPWKLQGDGTLLHPVTKLTLVQTRADDGGGKPMFDVCADGVKVGEVYFNMTGFTGYFKLPHKPKTGFQLSEGSLARIKRELAEFERDHQPVTAKNGLLWQGKRQISLPEADIVAHEHGFQCAEQLVKHLSK